MVTYHLPIILFFIYKYRPPRGFKKEPRNSQEVLNVCSFQENTFEEDQCSGLVSGNNCI